MRQPIPGSQCRNCGRELPDMRYCPDCGQLNDTRRLTFRELLGDALANLFAMDSKFAATFWPLMGKPGRVPERFLGGHKVRFVPPIRFYLLSTFLLLFSYSVNRLVIGEEGRAGNPLSTTSDPVIAVNDGSDLKLDFGSNPKGWALFMDRAQNHVLAHPDQTGQEALESMGYPNTFWNRFWYGQVYKFHHLEGEEFIEYFRSHLLLILFAFIPVFALLLKLFYWRRDFFYYDHLVFALYTQSVFFLLLALTAVLDTLALGDFSSLALTFFAVYLFLAMKRFYRQGTGKTIAKYLMINMSYFFLAIVFLVLSAMVTFILY